MGSSPHGKSLPVLVVGASSGIGKASVEAVVARGHRVYGTSRDGSRVRTPGVTGLSLEIGDTDSVERAVQSVIAAEGRLDAIFYAAGFYTAGAIEETTPEQVHDQLDAYLVGAHRVTRAVLPHFRQAGAGRLLFMSSGAGDSTLPFHAIYSLSKAALQAYCDGLRYEVEPFGIQVSYLQAGGVKTGASAGFRAAAEPIGARSMKPVLRVDQFSRLIPVLKRVLPASIFRAQLARSLCLAGAHDVTQRSETGGVK